MKTDLLNLICGGWLISNAFSYSYGRPALRLSDLICGTLVIIYSLARQFGGSRRFSWASCLVGLWLLLAPLLFWAPSAAVYSNDTLLGCLIIAIGAWSAHVPAPATGLREIPEAWSYNPSAWSQRLPIIGLALLGFFSARHLAAFQLGHLSSVWEPFFGSGTERILTSEVSKTFPVSDAGLGAFSYLLDALAGSIGDKRRWRTMPWIVVLFGLMIIPPGLTSITLVILQPVAVGSWCTLCLFTAFIMLLMVPPALDEVVASAQFLVASKRQGKPFWTTFWKGEQLEAAALVRPSPLPETGSPDRRYRPPWSLLASTGIGIWLMFAPSALGMEGMAASNAYIVAALALTFSIIAIAEIGRPLRYVNVPLAIWLFASAWLLSDLNPAVRGVTALSALALGVLSLPLGPVRRHYGSYDRWIQWSPLRRGAPQRDAPRKAA